MDYRIGLIDSNEIVRQGRALVFNSQPNMRVVLEERDIAMAIQKVPDYLVDVLFVGPIQNRINGGELLARLCRALKDAKNDCAVVAYGPYSDSKLRTEALINGAQDYIGLDQPAERQISLVKLVSKRDFLADLSDLSSVGDAGQFAITNLQLEAKLAEISDQDAEVIKLFLSGWSDQDVAKKFDSARTRVTKLIDGLVETAGFSSRNQLAIYLQGERS